MEELLLEILEELRTMNEKLDSIKGDGIHYSISNINDNLEDIKEYGYNSIADINNNLETIRGYSVFK